MLRVLGSYLHAYVHGYITRGIPTALNADAGRLPPMEVRGVEANRPKFGSGSVRPRQIFRIWLVGVRFEPNFENIRGDGIRSLDACPEA